MNVVDLLNDLAAKIGIGRLVPEADMTPDAAASERTTGRTNPPREPSPR